MIGYNALYVSENILTPRKTYPLHTYTILCNIFSYRIFPLESKVTGDRWSMDQRKLTPMYINSNTVKLRLVDRKRLID